MSEQIKYKGQWISQEEYERIIKSKPATTLHGGLSNNVPLRLIHSSNLVPEELDQEVMNSVATEGYEYPIKVRRCNCPRIKEPHFEAIDGHNRLAGLKAAGQTKVSVVIRNVKDDIDVLDIMKRTDEQHKKSQAWISLMINTMVKLTEEKNVEDAEGEVARKIKPTNIQSGRTIVSRSKRIANMIFDMTKAILDNPENFDFIKFPSENGNGQITGEIGKQGESFAQNKPRFICGTVHSGLFSSLRTFSRNQLLKLCKEWERTTTLNSQVAVIQNLSTSSLNDYKNHLNEENGEKKESSQQEEETPQMPQESERIQTLMNHAPERVVSPPATRTMPSEHHHVEPSKPTEPTKQVEPSKEKTAKEEVNLLEKVSTWSTEILKRVLDGIKDFGFQCITLGYNCPECPIRKTCLKYLEAVKIVNDYWYANIWSISPKKQEPQEPPIF